MTDDELFQERPLAAGGWHPFTVKDAKLGEDKKGRAQVRVGLEMHDVEPGVPYLWTGLSVYWFQHALNSFVLATGLATGEALVEEIRKDGRPKAPDMAALHHNVLGRRGMVQVKTVPAEGAYPAKNELAGSDTDPPFKAWEDEAGIPVDQPEIKKYVPGAPPPPPPPGEDDLEEDTELDENDGLPD